MQTLIAVIALVSAVVFSAGHASEIDSVTPRKVELPDSLAAINAIFDQRIRTGIDNANKKRVITEVIEGIPLVTEGEYCNENDLYAELRKAIFDSMTASWGLKGYDLDLELRGLLAKQSYSLSLNDSIYRDIDYIEGFSLKLKELSDVIRIDGHLVGLDKLGHFFSEGWQYFELTEDVENNIDDALTWGKEKESGLYGYTTTGIFSFADLVANFNGWRFWNKVLLKHDDPLKGFIAQLFDRPYVTCDIQILDSLKQRKLVKAWEYNSRFDFSEYIDGAWDEGNNCNSYADPIIEAKVMARIHNVDPGFACPVNPGACSEAREKYGEFARQVLHPFCLIAQ
jgi:hypothetical protein